MESYAKWINENEIKKLSCFCKYNFRLLKILIISLVALIELYNFSYWIRWKFLIVWIVMMGWAGVVCFLIVAEISSISLWIFRIFIFIILLVLTLIFNLFFLQFLLQLFNHRFQNNNFLCLFFFQSFFFNKLQSHFSHFNRISRFLSLYLFS